MKVLNILILAYFAFFSHPLFAGQEETKAAKEECTEAAIDYGIEEADRADYITNCVEEIILDNAKALKDSAELEEEVESEEYETEQANN